MCIPDSVIHEANDTTLTQSEIKLQYCPPILKNITLQGMRHGTGTYYNDIAF